jgi:hypothetical protein
VSRILPIVLILGFTIFCLVDCTQTPADEVKGLPKVLWLVVIVLLPLVGGVLWLLAAHMPDTGRGGNGGGGGGRGFGGSGGPGGRGSSRPPLAPDDDDDFLRGLNSH